MSIKLLIADDHEVVRYGLRSLMADTDIEIVAEATTGEQAIQMAMERRPGRRAVGHPHARWRWAQCTRTAQAGTPRDGDPDALDVRQSDVRGASRGAGGRRLRPEGG